jgi:hypothetical protein
MIGIEVVALVAAIVSCYTGTASYLKERKQRKLEKAQKKKEELSALQVAIRSAKPEVQGQYDVGFSKIGPTFASGDGKIRQKSLFNYIKAYYVQQLRRCSFWRFW